MTDVNARLENPIVFGLLVGALYLLFRVAVMHSSVADALVNALYIAAIALLVRAFMNRAKAARK